MANVWLQMASLWLRPKILAKPERGPGGPLPYVQREIQSLGLRCLSAGGAPANQGRFTGLTDCTTAAALAVETPLASAAAMVRPLSHAVAVEVPATT